MNRFNNLLLHALKSFEFYREDHKTKDVYDVIPTQLMDGIIKARRFWCTIKAEQDLNNHENELNSLVISVLIRVIMTRKLSFHTLLKSCCTKSLPEIRRNKMQKEKPKLVFKQLIYIVCSIIVQQESTRDYVKQREKEMRNVNTL